ncbi:phosphoserine phosphatase SerB [Bifidobacterium aemilianum]|uniref:phosphoserine phosphatase n=1 Tax=Bifidobacterium aemilianum TaxID=2493120 RepID=A0A366K9M0_9BIFI|nr:phosphoserine phosphatase SerB [Bifidobacterium aemilianum]RBP98426.1 phosphoserine phosphatase SerB [Bifidobacterium aemilianum]
MNAANRTMAHTPSLSRPGLLVIDVDSTLIEEEVIDQLGLAAGAGPQVAEITARAMAGELDFAGALEERVGLLKGLDQSVFERVHAGLHPSKGARELIASLHRHGWKVGVVSGGFHELVDMLAADLALDRCLANRLEVVDGRLTGRTLGPIISKESKLQALQAWAQAYGVGREQTVAMGDGANDIPMIQWAGLGVAFCAKPVVRQAAQRHIDTRDLTALLDLLQR